MGFFESNGNWIIALGKTLIHSIWIGVLIFSLLKIAMHQFAGASSRIKYGIAVSALTIYAGAVIALFFWLYTPANSSSFILPAGLNAARFIHSQDSEGFNYKIIYIVCSYLYFSGVLFVIMRSLLSFRNLRRLKRSGTRVQGKWMERFLLISRNLGIRVEVGLHESKKVMVPAMIGLFRPVILVPAGMLTSLPANQVETILMHELYHLRRLDFLVNIFQMVLEDMFFYNPAVKYISKLIRTERENCCDDLVLQHCGRPLDYARALFTLAENFNSGSVFYPAAGGADQNQLFNRIKRILNQSNMKTNIRERWTTLSLLTCGIAVLLSLSGFSKSISKIEDDYINEKIMQKSHIEKSGPDQKTSMNGESNRLYADPVVYDTILREEENLREEEKMNRDKEEFESMHKDALKEAIEDIDWEDIRKEIEEARREAPEELDWDKIKREIEEARKEVMEEIDWEEIKREMDEATAEALKEIDLEDIKKELDSAMMEIGDVDWEKIRLDIERSIAELKNIDIEEIREEVEKALESIRTD